MEGFTSSLASLGVTDLPSIPSAYPDQNPLDIFRSHIAERLAPIAGVEPEAVFAGLDRATKPETGDFVLAVPRLRIKGAKPQELGEKWQSQVPPFLIVGLISSLENRRYLKKWFQKDHSCNFSFRIKLLLH